MREKDIVKETVIEITSKEFKEWLENKADSNQIISLAGVFNALHEKGLEKAIILVRALLLGCMAREKVENLNMTFTDVLCIVISELCNYVSLPSEKMQGMII